MKRTETCNLFDMNDFHVWMADNYPSVDLKEVPVDVVNEYIGQVRENMLLKWDGLSAWGRVSHERGHEIKQLIDDGPWVYSDNEEPIGKRNCIRCGKPPTEEGYDACLGRLEGVEYACCGHGVYDKYIIRKGQK